jgi:folate-binding protein YgfZ
VSLIAEGGSQLTGVCNAKGRLVASPYLLLKDNEYYLAITQPIAEILFKYWKPYLMISRVQALLCEDFHAYGFLTAPGLETPYTIQLAGNTKAQIIFSDKDLALSSDTSELDWFNELVNSGAVIIQPETGKELMPITLGYEKFNALSFNKGCYVGQEILARVHYKGSVKKEVRTISFAEAITIQANQEICDAQGKTIGHIALSPGNDIAVTQTLAVINKNRESSSYYLNSEDKPTIVITH